MSPHNRRYRILTVVALAFLVLVPLHGDATSHLLLQLCNQVPCTGALTVLPRIEQLVPFISNITPGGSVAIKGSGLGSAEGELYLKGLKTYLGMALDEIRLTIPKEPGKDFWKTTAVLGLIPANIVQVLDQPARLQIRTKSGTWSNEFPVNFTAAREDRLLSYTDPVVKVIRCGTDSNKDICNASQDPDDLGSYPPVIPGCGAATFCGLHSNCYGCVGDDVDSDIFEVRLKNGWVFTKLDTSVMLDEGYVLGLSGLPVGGTYWRPQITWKATSWETVFYRAYVRISGRKGVPWK